jgi:glutamyl-tRNA synthetase
VGGLRTALYNYLFAKHHGGTNIIRIEDTDRTRFVEGAQENLLDSLKWAGIEYDEGPGFGGDKGPYIQSERTELYREHAQKLIEADKAYYAFDTQEELAEMRERQKKSGLPFRYDRSSMKTVYTLGEEKTKQMIADGVPHVVRLKVPQAGEIRFSDIIRGEVVVPARDVDDQVLLKADGFPTYHLANIVDDHLMEITHVIRGEEWLPSTPKHALLYDAFGWERPKFAHLPLLLNSDGSKLSKRQGDVAVEDYRKKGYAPEAFLNFIALLGWNPSGEREIYTKQEFIDAFNIEKVNKGGAVFDMKKLDWMNGEYLKAKDPLKIAEEIMPQIKEKGWDESIDYVAKVVELLRERVDFAHSIPEFGPYMFEVPERWEEEYYTKFWNDEAKAGVQPITDRFKETNDWTEENLSAIAKGHIKEEKLKMGKILNALRLIVTRQHVGADLFKTMDILGKEETLKRIDDFYSKAD